MDPSTAVALLGLLVVLAVGGTLARRGRTPLGRPAAHLADPEVDVWLSLDAPAGRIGLELVGHQALLDVCLWLGQRDTAGPPTARWDRLEVGGRLHLDLDLSPHEVHRGEAGGPDQDEQWVELPSRLLARREDGRTHHSEWERAYLGSGDC